MEEIWRDIQGYKNYQVSNLGRVKSLNYKGTGEERVLKPLKDKDGYLQTDLYKNGKRKRFKIHRLVAQAFLENSLNKPFINHIDCDRQNNCVNNLEWCTAKENAQYASKLGRMDGTKGRTNNDKNTPIIAINLATGEEIYFYSQQEATKQLNLDRSHLNQVLKGKCKTAKGYTFKYITNKQQENTLF